MPNKEQIKGEANQAKGHVKESVGKAIDNKEMQAKGKADQAKGKYQEAVGDAKEGVKKATDKAADRMSR
jgi:uncharacterized protein YjbJ (UPF0337 family)